MQLNHNENSSNYNAQMGAPSSLLMQNRGAVHFLSVFSSVCLTIFIVFLVGLIPVSTDVSQYRDVLMPVAYAYLAPEPLEMPQYALIVILLPCLYLAANLLFKRIPADKQRLNFVLAFVFDVLLLAATGGIGLYQAASTFDIISSFWPRSILLAAFILVACYMERRQYHKISGEVLGRLCFVLIFAATLILGFYLVCRVNRMMQNDHFSMHHFYAWWYPIYKVGSGMTIGVDFDCLYGFYPYLVVPFLKLLGGVNQQSLSLYLACVLSLISVCYFAFSYRFIKSKLLAGIAGCAASFYGPLVSNYLAWHPTRTLFPALVLGGAAVYSSLKNKGKRIMRALMALLLGLGIAWNTEMGFVAAISWAGYLIFTSAEKNGLLGKKNLINIGKVILLSLLSVAVAIVFIEGITYHRSAGLIGLDSILFGLTVFAGTGFIMVKVTFDTWVMVALPIVAGLFASLPYITKNRALTPLPENKAAALFTASIIAIGSFSYFVGRSVPSNSLAYLAYDAMICGILAELFMERAAFAKQNGCNVTLRLLEKAKVFLSVLMIISILIWAAINVQYCFSDEYSEEHLKPDIASEIVNTTALKVKAWSEKNELSDTPHLLIYQSCYVNEVLMRPSSETVCEQIDWFYRENAHTYIDFLQKHPDESFVIDEQALKSLQELYPEDLAEALSSFRLSETIPAKSVDHTDLLLYAYLPVTAQQ